MTPSMCVSQPSLPCRTFYFFFFNDTATTEIYTLSLHDALPILAVVACACAGALSGVALCGGRCVCHFVFLVGAMACMVPREGRAAHPPAVRSDKAEELGARRRA